MLPFATLVQTDPYSILELPWGASAAEIRASFRRLALKYHPDRNGHDAEAAERFKYISAAYQRLKESGWELPRSAMPPGQAPGDFESAWHDLSARSAPRPEYWPDGAPIHYPSPEDIEAVLRGGYLSPRVRRWLAISEKALYVLLALLIILTILYGRMRGWQVL